MSDQTAQEPTMEEILASIRRIISEDDAPPAAAAAPEPEPEPQAAPAPAAFTPAEPDDEDEDVLELTETVSDVETLGDLDVYPKAEAAPEPEAAAASWDEPEIEAAAEPAPEAYVAPAYTPSSNVSVHGEMTVVELVRAILEPKLNEWADENLERVVDSAVRQILTEKLGRVFR
jgi:cell pole-organizing protein PopZ